MGHHERRTGTGTGSTCPHFSQVCMLGAFAAYKMLRLLLRVPLNACPPRTFGILSKFLWAFLLALNRDGIFQILIHFFVRIPNFFLSLNILKIFIFIFKVCIYNSKLILM